MSAPMLFVFALLTLAGYVCRFDMLQFRLHRLGIIMLHWAGGGSTAWALVMAGRVMAGDTSADVQLMGCWLAVAMAASWLWVSYSSWRDGVPPHYMRAQPVRARGAWLAD